MRARTRASPFEGKVSKFRAGNFVVLKGGTERLQRKIAQKDCAERLC